MAVAIRLMRFGKKGAPFYRIVALDKRKKRDGAYIEEVGTYNPFAKNEQVTYKVDRVEYWLKNGAQVSEGMQKLFKKTPLKK